MSEQILQNYITDTSQAFLSYKKMAEKALEQVTDDEFFRAIDPESNSLAVIAKHIGGNLRSRWTDFLTTDGEKPDRFRDTEFVDDADTRASIRSLWETGWSALSAALGSLTPADLSKTVTIRAEEFTVERAMTRSLAHTCSHVGQIVFLAKHLRSTDWKNLSIPRNTSEEFRSFMAEKREAGEGFKSYLEAHEEFKEKSTK
jgi:Protein of unknown function (DUF1572)